MYGNLIYLSYKSWRHELLPSSFQTGWKSFRDKDTIMMIFSFAKFGFLEIIPHVIHVCYFQIIDGKNHWYVCSFLWSKMMWFVNLVEYQWMLHYMYIKPWSVFFTVGIKAIGWDVIQVHRRKIYKCARCLRFNDDYVIGYHTSKRISFFINFWLKFSKDMIFVKQVLIPRTCQCLCLF